MAAELSRVAVKVDAQAVQTPVKVLQVPHLSRGHFIHVLMPELYCAGGQAARATQDPLTRA